LRDYKFRYTLETHRAFEAAGIMMRKRFRTISKRRSIQYALSVPERLVRSFAALSAGVVREVAEVALPIGLRRGRLYRNLVDATLRFLIEQVGRVEGVYPPEQKLAEDFLLRRAAGNGIEAMGILAFRASPVWVLAALADICGFGRQMIPEIAEALEKEGLLARGESFTTMDQLLEGLENTAAQLADTVNAPPLDIAGLRLEWNKLVDQARRLPSPRLPSRSTVTGLWADLAAAAAEQDRSVFEVSSLLAISAVSTLPKRARILSRSAALAAGKSGGVLSQALLDHYRLTLREVGEIGFLDYGTRQLTPYLRAALRGFSPQQETTTGGLVRKL
jgi:hypothetical protein